MCVFMDFVILIFRMELNNFLIKLSEDKINELNSLEILLDKIIKDNDYLLSDTNEKVVASGQELEKPLKEITVKLSKLLLKKQRLLLFGILKLQKILNN